MTIKEVYEKVIAEMDHSREQSRLALEKGHKDIASEWSKRRSHFGLVASWLEETEEINPRQKP